MHGLLIASKLKDQKGKNIRDLLKTLEPHFHKEKELALPILGTIPEQIPRSERQRFFEHESLRKIISEAAESASKENHLDVLELFVALAYHSKVEEEVLYPVALFADVTARLISVYDSQTILE